MDFEERLQRAIERGHKTAEHHADAACSRRLNEEQLRRLYSQYRLEFRITSSERWQSYQAICRDSATRR